MVDDIIFLWIGRIVVMYLAFLLLSKVYHILTVHVFQSCPDFSHYGKWSGVLN